jgi:hypothetical protein
MNYSHRKQLIALVLFSALAVPAQLFAQALPKQPHYKFFDLGTLGGPASYISNDPSNDGAASGILSPRGIVVGAADTSIPDPSCSNPDCFVAHAFQSQNGLMTDLGALPGVNNSFANWISPTGLLPLSHPPAIAEKIIRRDRQGEAYEL